ncbi:MAG: DUF6677 family protein [Acidithiobacillales bacterium]
MLALLLPGLGQVAVGRPKRGLALGLVVAVTFLTGLLLHGTLPRPVAGEPLSWLGAAAIAATGLFGGAAWALGAGRPDLAPTNEAGSAFLLTAGIMSLLLLLDAADRACRGTS